MSRQLHAIAVHGGAGNGIPAAGSETRSIHAALEAAVAAATARLASGGSALDAVEAAVIVLEDAPQFNAGRGSARTSAGAVEMDAGIMCGRTLMAGGVALVSAARNPISLARLVLEEGRHVLIAGEDADDFARHRGARMEQPAYFSVAGPEPDGREPDATEREPDATEREPDATELGTVGAVVRDGSGNLAAATSTGGVAGQRPGRIGDSPIVGAGLYAENRSCAVSCTGSGEDIMRTVLAHRIARAVEEEASTAHACEQAVRGALTDAGGAGGVIAVDVQGNIGMCFNTAVMHRAWKVADGPVRTAST